jgi:MYXO-CTERM domain-containing protein
MCVAVYSRSDDAASPTAWPLWLAAIALGLARPRRRGHAVGLAASSDRE